MRRGYKGEGYTKVSLINEALISSSILPYETTPAPFLLFSCLSRGPEGVTCGCYPITSRA